MTSLRLLVRLLVANTPVATRLAGIASVTFILVVSFVVAVGCTTDDDPLEGRACDVSLPREKQCVSGYACTCEAGSVTSCTCKRTGLRQLDNDDVHATSPAPSPAGQRVGAPLAPKSAQHARPVDDDPSKRLLRRIGIDVQ